MHVSHLHRPEQLADLAADWDRLAAGEPFLSHAWHTTWWRHFAAAGSELFVLTVHDRGRVRLIAPWYIEETVARGRVIRFLGSGEVCTDHLTLLTEPEHEQEAIAALATWLTEGACHPPQPQGTSRNWDLLALSDIDEADRPLLRLLEQLQLRGNTVDRRSRLNTWLLELPDDWESYLAALSKSHRKQMRRIVERQIVPGRATLRMADSPASLAEGWPIFIDLHQRRRNSLGEPGCFANERFAAFLTEIAPAMLARRQLALAWAVLDGAPIAAELMFRGPDRYYAYQAGVDPQQLDEEPGRLASVLVIQQAINEGLRGIDFLRGDEAYKAHLRAAPHATCDALVVPGTTVSQIRHSVWTAGLQMKDWLRGLVTQ